MRTFIEILAAAVAGLATPALAYGAAAEAKCKKGAALEANPACLKAPKTSRPQP